MTALTVTPLIGEEAPSLNEVVLRTKIRHQHTVSPVVDCLIEFYSDLTHFVDVDKDEVKRLSQELRVFKKQHRNVSEYKTGYAYAVWQINNNRLPNNLLLEVVNHKSFDEGYVTALRQGGVLSE